MSSADGSSLIQRIPKFVKKYPTLRSVPYWVGAVLVGFASVAYARAFEWCGETMIHMLKEHPYAMLVLSPLFFVVGWALVRFIPPAAGGSGIPQVMAALEKGPQVPEKELSRLLGLRVLVVKVVSSMFCVLGGGVIGREGPTIQVSASLFCTIHRRFGKLANQLNPVPWIIAGSAAGLAAAFNTPLGGVVFAIEELASMHFNQFKIAVLSSVIISGLIAQWVLGSYLYLGFFKLVALTLPTFLWAMLAAILSAVAACWFTALLSAGTRILRQRTLPFRASCAALCGLILVLLGILTHTNVLHPGAKLVHEVLLGSDEVLSWPLVLGRYLAMVVSYLSGCAGGIFAPSLSMGAQIGGQLAHAFGVEPVGLLAMAGLTAFLSAVTRVPFTSAVLVLEMTDRHGAVFLVMCSALVAYAVGYLMNPEPFYHQQMRYFMDDPNAPSSVDEPSARTSR